ncbi:MAG: lactonase family protein [Verrucomicrobiota bacterium]
MIRSFKIIPISLFIGLSSLLFAEKLDVFFGTVGKKANGIYQATFDQNTGHLSEPKRIVDTRSPGFLATHPSLPIIYAVARTSDGGIVQAFRIRQDSEGLEEINQVAIPLGNGAHISVHPSGAFLFTAQYGAGTVAVFPLETDGRVMSTSQVINHTGPSNVHEKRQNAPHPHWTGFSPDGRFAFAPDLGTDRIEIYRVNTDRSLTSSSSVKSLPGSGPRHMRFSKDGRFIYLLNELSVSLGIYTYDPSSGSAELNKVIPALTTEEKITAKNSTSSEILVHPSGNFVYTANRGHDSISVFSSNPAGDLSRIQLEPARAASPRHINLSPNANWLIAAGQKSNNVSVFAVDSASGELTFLEDSIREIPSVSCILFIE